MEPFREILKKQLGSVADITSCRGGDISKSYRVRTDSGASYFLKVNRREFEDMFLAEKVGLKYLAEHSSFRTPKVLDLLSLGESSGILMEWIEASTPDALSWKKLGEGLSELHSSQSEKFGFEMENYIGTLRQQNRWDENWVEFWIERRIAPLANQALDRGVLKQTEVMPFLALFEQMRTHLGSYGFTPRLLHGDLWSGNLMFDENGAPTLIDPAVYFGWPEMELAFMDLFGGFDPAWKESYRPAVQELFLGDSYYHIWQIYPLLVHTILFGGMYHRRLMTCVKHALEVF